MKFQFQSLPLSILLPGKAVVIKVVAAVVNIRHMRKKRMNLSHLKMKRLKMINNRSLLNKTKLNIHIQIIVLYSEY